MSLADADLTIAADDARKLAEAILAAAGTPARHAEAQAELLIEAELRGYPSHGLLRLPRLARRIHSGMLDPTATGELMWTHSGRLRVNGQRGLGAVIAQNSLTAITDRARRTGVATAVIHNTNHLGMLAIYAERVALGGQTFIGTTTSEALVHPWGGQLAMIGTNPLAIAVPSTGSPLVLDMATGVVSMGKIHAYAAQGRALEPGWAVDAMGRPTTNATAAISGAISPFGGAKGYGLGIALEVLVSTLTGSALGREVSGTLDDDQLCNKGDVFIVIEPSTGMAEATSNYLEAVRSSPASDPETSVTVPGDRSGARRTRALAEGLSVPPALWAELTSLLECEAERRRS